MLILTGDLAFMGIAIGACAYTWHLARRIRRACPGCARIRATRAELVNELQSIGDDTQPSAEYGPWVA